MVMMILHVPYEVCFEAEATPPARPCQAICFYWQALNNIVRVITGTSEWTLQKVLPSPYIAR